MLALYVSLLPALSDDQGCDKGGYMCSCKHESFSALKPTHKKPHENMLKRPLGLSVCDACVSVGLAFGISTASSLIPPLLLSEYRRGLANLCLVLCGCECVCVSVRRAGRTASLES